MTALVLRTATRSPRLRGSALSRRYPSPAVGILLPLRHPYSSGPSTSHGGVSGDFPPPGFNAEQAKKPLPQDAQRRQMEEAKAAEPPAPKIEANMSAVEGRLDPSSAQVRTKIEDQTTSREASAEKSNTEAKKEEKSEAKKEEKKLTMWQKVKKEAAHYRDGTVLLGTEVKISFKLALKMAAGYELSRRENRQVSAFERCLFS